MKKRQAYRLINYLAATVWLINGLLCKVLNLVPRHEKIVARIFYTPDSRLITSVIGVAEIVMAIWIVSNFYSRLNTISQIIVIAIMNILEFFLAPDLLVWGKANIFFAFLFIFLLCYKEFFIIHKINQRSKCYPS